MRLYAIHEAKKPRSAGQQQGIGLLDVLSTGEKLTTTTWTAWSCGIIATSQMSDCRKLPTVVDPLGSLVAFGFPVAFE